MSRERVRQGLSCQWKRESNRLSPFASKLWTKMEYPLEADADSMTHFKYDILVLQGERGA